ncbi:MAG: 30S ribosomal protein S8 [Nitrospirota bacterium]|nr:30S ribosomal protein S8 [Nitrospirota bacterium]
MTDPIADLLARIRNAKQRKHKDLYLPFSKIKRDIASILKEEGFIRGYKTSGTTGFDEIKITLKYGHAEDSVITDLKRISKPGRRVYVGWDDIPYVKRGLGIAILSTSKGLLTDKKSRKEKVGGEILCYVW